jgi:hypothetical protein
LQFFKDFSDKHIFLLQSDFNPLEILSEHNIKIFCDSCPKQSDSIYPLPFFVQHAPDDLVQKPITDAEYDISFQGCVSTSQTIRTNMVDKIKKYPSYKIYLETTSQYFYCLFRDENIKSEKTRYYNNIINSKFVLCPRGTGSTSSRFFETIWFGRVPVLIADDTKLPLESIIHWDDLIVRVSEKDMNIHEKIQQFLSSKNIEEVSVKLKSIALKYFDRALLHKLIKSSLLEEYKYV